MAEQHNFKVDVVILANGGCKYGKQFDNVKVTIETALNYFPLDYKKCVREGGCICCVAFEPRRDENGRVIKKKY